MADYEIAHKKTVKVEAGYANSKSDYGRETYRGVSRRWFPDSPIWIIVDAMRNDSKFPACLDNNIELQALIPPFYKKEFWDKLSGDLIPSQAVANKLFGFAVNKGWQDVAEWLQRCLNVLNQRSRLYKNLKVDGDIGNKTITAMDILHRKKGDSALLKSLNVLQGYHFFTTCERDETQEDNYHGWMNKQISI